VTTKLTEMTGAQLFEWFDEYNDSFEPSLAALRDGVVAEVRAAWQASEDDWKRRFAEMRARAERAERERDEWVKLANARGDERDENARELTKAEAALAEARREEWDHGFVDAVHFLRNQREYISHDQLHEAFSAKKSRNPYAPPVPASVDLNGFRVTHNRGIPFPWRVTGRFGEWRSWTGVCSALGIDPTDEQIAALRALAEARQ
jgi:hypothetical protein